MTSHSPLQGHPEAEPLMSRCGCWTRKGLVLFPGTLQARRTYSSRAFCFKPTGGLRVWRSGLATVTRLTSEGRGKGSYPFGRRIASVGRPTRFLDDGSNPSAITSNLSHIVPSLARSGIHERPFSNPGSTPEAELRKKVAKKSIETPFFKTALSLHPKA